MEGHSKLKYFLTLFAILLFFIIVYFFYQVFIIQRPYKTVEISNVPGTTLASYKNAPPDFPKELLLENEPLTYSNVLVTPYDKQDIVTYISPNKMSDVVKMYMETLPKIGWVIVNRLDTQNNAVIDASNNTGTVSITIVLVKDNSTALTFQYIKYK